MASSSSSVAFERLHNSLWNTLALLNHPPPPVPHKLVDLVQKAKFQHSSVDCLCSTLIQSSNLIHSGPADGKQGKIFRFNINEGSASLARMNGVGKYDRRGVRRIACSGNAGFQRIDHVFNAGHDCVGIGRVHVRKMLSKNGQ